MAQQNKARMSSVEKAGIGAGIAAAAAAAALGAYFLYGKNGQANRKKVKGWMLKARGEVLERLEDMENVSEDAYERIVQSVIKNYKGLKNVTGAELLELAADMRKHWKSVKPAFQAGKRKQGSSARKSPPKKRPAGRKTSAK